MVICVTLNFVLKHGRRQALVFVVVAFLFTRYVLQPGIHRNYIAKPSQKRGKPSLPNITVLLYFFSILVEGRVVWRIGVAVSIGYENQFLLLTHHWCSLFQKVKNKMIRIYVQVSQL